MKEALKYLDLNSFDHDEEALSAVSIEDAKHAVTLGIIEELESINKSIANAWVYDAVEVALVKYITDLIKN